MQNMKQQQSDVIENWEDRHVQKLGRDCFIGKTFGQFEECLLQFEDCLPHMSFETKCFGVHASEIAVIVGMACKRASSLWCV